MGIGIKELEGRLYSRYFTGVLLINCYVSGESHEPN
jgi:hypothetical protein